MHLMTMEHYQRVRGSRESSSRPAFISDWKNKGQKTSIKSEWREKEKNACKGNKKNYKTLALELLFYCSGGRKLSFFSLKEKSRKFLA